MSTAIRLVEHDHAGGVQEPSLRLAEARWTTKQVMASCLWSALFGLGCGCAWVLLQINDSMW